MRLSDYMKRSKDAEEDFERHLPASLTSDHESKPALYVLGELSRRVTKASFRTRRGHYNAQEVDAYVANLMTLVDDLESAMLEADPTLTPRSSSSPQHAAPSVPLDDAKVAQAVGEIMIRFGAQMEKQMAQVEAEADEVITSALTRSDTIIAAAIECRDIVEAEAEELRSELSALTAMRDVAHGELTATATAVLATLSETPQPALATSSPNAALDGANQSSILRPLASVTAISAAS